MEKGRWLKMYFKRRAYERLQQWKEENTGKVMEVSGARQVGKTYLLKKFASENFKNVIYINFVEEPKYKLITEDGYKTDDIIRNISA